MGRGRQEDTDLDQILAGINSYDPDAGATTVRTPIGLGGGVRTPSSRSGMVGPPQLYFTEDVYRPQQWSTPQRLNWQLALANAGILTSEDWAPGIWNATTQAAYREVLAYANQNGLTKEEALAEIGSNPTLAMLQAAAKAGSGSGRTVTLANPQDLQAAANEVAPNVIGRRFTQEELDAFVKSFHSAQHGGNPPSLDVAAEAKAREIDPTAAAGRDLVGVFDVALNMMRGGNGA